MGIDALVTALNAVTPLTLAGGLAYIIYELIRQRQRIHNIADNHLHSLPDVVEALKRIESTLKDVNDNIVYIRARVNGK